MGATATNWILSQPWAMLPEMVETFLSVANRTNDLEAVLARRGEPLDNARTVEMHNGVAVVPVHGPISRYADMFTEISGGVSVDTLARDIRTARDSADVKAIVLDMDTPGGQAAGIGELAGHIRQANSVKPVVAYGSNLMASAGLWLGAAAGRVVIAPQAILGSMGVVWPVSRQTKEDREQVIEFVSSQSPNKRPDMETKEGRGEMQGVVDAMAEAFIADVAQYRGIDPAKIAKAFGLGGLRVGKAAVACGMADAIGTLESCIEELSNPKKRGSMKINIGAFITGLMSKGVNAEVDSSVIQSAIEDATGGAPAVETVESRAVAAENPNFEAALAEARELLRKEMHADLRGRRVELFTEQAGVFLSLHSAHVLPSEASPLNAAFVAAALLDAESPIEGFSVLGGFKASIAARKPHGQTVEVVTGDAATIAAHLSAKSLKTIDSAAATPEDAKAAEDAKRFEALLNATEEGRVLLAEMQRSAK